MTRCYVYFLICPVQQLPRYTGISIRPGKRLVGHLKEIHGNKQTHKANWLRWLYSRGQYPKLRIIGTFDSIEEAKSAEVFFIADGRTRNWPLTNATHGGDGTFGHTHSADSKRKMSASHNRQPRLITDATREKMRIAKRGYVSTGSTTPEARRKISLGVRAAWCDGRMHGHPVSHNHRTAIVASNKRRKGTHHHSKLKAP